MNDIIFKIDYINSEKRFRVIENSRGKYLYDGWISNLYILPHFFLIEKKKIQYKQTYESNANIFLNDVLNQHVDFSTSCTNVEEDTVSISELEDFFSINFTTIDEKLFFESSSNLRIFKIINRVINKKFTNFNCLKCKNCAYMRICCMKRINENGK